MQWISCKKMKIILDHMLFNNFQSKYLRGKSLVSLPPRKTNIKMIKFNVEMRGKKKRNIL